eukprot:4915755-Pyramimonas_sp.AAC.1
MGTDALKFYITDVILRYGIVIKFALSARRSAGISGRTERSKGLAEIPLGTPLPGVGDATIHADLIGDVVSRCPGLLPLSIMFRLQSSILCGVLQGREDVVVIVKINDIRGSSRAHSMPRTFCRRWYLTASCHHLLPMGRFERGHWSEQNKVRIAVRQYFKEVKQTSSSNQSRQSRKSKGIDASSLLHAATASGNEGERGHESGDAACRVNLAPQLAP